MIRVAPSNEEVAAERAEAQAGIKGSRLPSLLATFEPGPYGITRAGLDLMDAVETGLAACRTVHKRLQELYPERAIVLANALSLWVGIQVLHDALPGTDVRVGGTFSSLDILALIGREQMTTVCLADYAQYLNFYKGHSNPEKRVDVPGGPLRCTQAYFQLLGNTLVKIVQSHNDYALVQDTRIEILGRRFEGLTAVVESAPSDLLDVHLDDIVGNGDFVQAGKRLARDVAGFDFESRQNPKRLNPILFAMGDPGCGKTVTCHALGHYFLNFCRERDIPARFLVIRRSDWASSYQNASAAQLIDIFKTKVAAFPGVVGVYWPDIDTAFAAREDPGARGEEKNILGAAFGIFDGTIIPKNGQWFMLCDANTLNMDKAAISRITQDPFTLRGPVSPDDFVVLTRDKKLKGHKDFVLMDDGQWQAFGQRCVDMKLSGRSIENVTRRVITEIEDFEYPDEYFRAPLARRQEILREQSQRIPFDRLISIIEHYQAFEKEAEERAYRARFQDRVQEIVFNMSAHQAAAAVAEGDRPGT